jgi:hypothetical protein
MDTVKAMETNTPRNKNLPLPSMPRTLEIVNHTCEALKPVGGGGGRVWAYQCRAAGDGEGAGDDLSRASLSSNGVGVSVYLAPLGWSPFHRSEREEGGRSSLPCSARLVAPPPSSTSAATPPRRQPRSWEGG